MENEFLVELLEEKTTSSPCVVLLTGATGFLGKVVLEELFRRNEYDLKKVIVLTRGKRGEDPKTRFHKKVATSPCFSKLPTEWVDSVTVVEAELSLPNCGMDALAYEDICEEVTHIIHCAASIGFQLPVAEAAMANINTSLNMLELARNCPKLQRMVCTSTAYVTPHKTGPIYEELSPLPWPAAQLYDDIQTGRLSEAEILRCTGHPNTYTLTKCIAEHLVTERRGNLPVTIVRPSIISASSQYPVPGWIDSAAAFAGFVCTFSTGMLRVIDGNPRAIVDIVPVDEVARRLIDEAILSNRSTVAGSSAPIVYAAAGLQNCLDLGNISGVVDDFFNNPILTKKNLGKTPRQQLRYVGERNLQYHFHDYMLHWLPMYMAKTYFGLRGDMKMRRRIETLAKTIFQLNCVFPYFTTYTFDFRPSVPLPVGFGVKEYIQLVCLGVQKNILPKRA